MDDYRMQLTRIAQQIARDANQKSPHGAALEKACRGFLCRADASPAEVQAAKLALRDCQELFGIDPDKVFVAAKLITALRAI